MAEIRRPDYSKISTRSQVYNVAPVQQSLSQGDENAGRVDMSIGKIFDEIQKGVGVFTEIYKQSEKTANVLEAKSLLLEKTKDTQKQIELLNTELPNTGYKHLKLKDVLDKFRELDGTGKSNLYIGKELKQNISALQLPSDLDENVKGLIEDQWLAMDVSIVNSLIGQVSDVQSKQTQEVLSRYDAVYKGDVLKAYMSNPPHVAKKIAEALRAKMDSNTLELGDMGTWTPSETQDQLLLNGQTMLEANYLSQFYENREQTLSKALNGDYKYKDKNGIEISLNPIYWKHHLLTDKEISFKKEITDNNNKEINRQELNLSEHARKLFLRVESGDKTFSFSKEFDKLSNDEEWSKIKPSIRHKIVSDAQINHLKKKEQIRIKNENIAKTAKNKLEQEKKQKEEEVLINDLRNKLVEVSTEFERNPNKALNRYARQDKNGTWVSKESAELQKITGNSKFEKYNISAHLLTRLQNKQQLEKRFEAQVLDGRAKEFANLLSRQSMSDLIGSGDVLNTYMKQVEIKDGKKRWVIDYSKFGNNDTYGAKQLLMYGIGYDKKDPNRTNRDVQSIQIATIGPILNQAVKQFENLTKNLRTTDWRHDQVTARMNEISNSYANNVVDRMIGGSEAKQSSVTPYKDGAEPQDEMRVLLASLDSHLESVSKIAEGKNDYTLEELITHTKNLKDPNLLPTKIFTSQHKDIVQRILPVFAERVKELTINKVETGFAKTEQENYFKEHGVYNMDAYFEWQVKHGVEDMSNLVPKVFLQQVEKIGSTDSVETAKDSLLHILKEIHKYGSKGGTNRLMAFQQIQSSIPHGFKGILDEMYVSDGEPNMILLEARWSELNIPNYEKLN